MGSRLWKALALALCLALCAPYAAVASAKSPKEASKSRQLLSAGASDTTLYALNEMYGRWLNAYVQSRIVPVAESNMQGATSHGPWRAKRDYGAAEAKDDGSLTEWADQYYITHYWSEYGQHIRSMVPGDSVTINGTSAIVTRVCDYPRESVYEEVGTLADGATIILQTCEPNTDLNRMVFAVA